MKEGSALESKGPAWCAPLLTCCLRSAAPPRRGFLSAGVEYDTRRPPVGVGSGAGCAGAALRSCGFTGDGSPPSRLRARLGSIVEALRGVGVG